MHRSSQAARVDSKKDAPALGRRTIVGSRCRVAMLLVAAIGVLTSAAVPTHGADALGMIEVRSITYEISDYLNIGDGNAPSVGFTATGTGTLWSAAFPEVNGKTIAIRQAFVLAAPGFARGAQDLAVRGLGRLEGRTAGRLLLDDWRDGVRDDFSGRVSGVAQQVGESGYRVRLTVDATTEGGGKLALDLVANIVIDVIGAGIISLDGSGTLQRGPQGFGGNWDWPHNN
jgi:hypothetical protein